MEVDVNHQQKVAWVRAHGHPVASFAFEAWGGANGAAMAAAKFVEREGEEWPIALDDAAKVRLRAIAAETGREVSDLIRSAAEEAALDYFRQRADDPARRAI